MEQNENFIKKAYRQALIPGMISILGGTVNILADGILVGQKMGTDGLAAINLCVPVYLLLCVVGSFLVSGTATQAAKAIGKNDIKTSDDCYNTAYLGGIAAGLAVSVVGLLLLEPITAVLCSEPALRGMVSVYTGITLLGALPKILIYVPFWYLRLDGRNRIVTLMMAVMGIGNILLDILFLFVFDTGVGGAAWASVISTAAACLLGLCCLRGKKSSFHLSFSLVRGQAQWMEIVKSGSPAALNNLLQALRTLFINSILLYFGGSDLVAVFMALNCVNAFSLCITDGVPQAASAMLGIYTGEYDNASVKLLIKRQWKSGAVYTLVFSAVVLCGAPALQMAYGFSFPLFLPLFCLALSFFPALWNSILITYYNVLGQSALSNLLIFSRVLVFAVGSLWALVFAGMSPWWFFLHSEVFTVLLWYGLTKWYSSRNKSLSRYLLQSNSLEREGRVLNFTVEGTTEAICDASAKITDFCEKNQMGAKQILSVSLSIEELLTVIADKNKGKIIDFDMKAFSLQGTIGIRIRYSGIEYNPFLKLEMLCEEEADYYIGICMIEKMAKKIIYRKTFGTNSLQIFV